MPEGELTHLSPHSLFFTFQLLRTFFEFCKHSPSLLSQYKNIKNKLVKYIVLFF